jgi:hypothetical protein
MVTGNPGPICKKVTPVRKVKWKKSSKENASNRPIVSIKKYAWQ